MGGGKKKKSTLVWVKNHGLQKEIGFHAENTQRMRQTGPQHLCWRSPHGRIEGTHIILPQPTYALIHKLYKYNVARFRCIKK